MLQLIEQQATVIDVNPRKEFHGEDEKLAVDIKIKVPLSNLLLAEFHPRLRSALYKKSDSQEQLPLPGDDHTPSLVFLQLGPLHWEAKYDHCDISITPQINGKIQLEDVDVNKIILEPEEGGTVQTTLRLQGYPTTTTLTRLCEILGQTVKISIVQKEPEPIASK